MALFLPFGVIARAVGVPTKLELGIVILIASVTVILMREASGSPAATYGERRDPYPARARGAAADAMTRLFCLRA